MGSNPISVNAFPCRVKLVSVVKILVFLLVRFLAIFIIFNIFEYHLAMTYEFLCL